MWRWNAFRFIGMELVLAYNTQQYLYSHMLGWLRYNLTLILFIIFVLLTMYVPIIVFCIYLLVFSICATLACESVGRC